MPGNEVGDRIHNFFGQDNWSQGQHQAQAVDGTWNGLNNNPWAGSHWQIGTSLISNLKNDNVHQPGINYAYLILLVFIGLYCFQ
jgi:hypothetical protein